MKKINIIGTGQVGKTLGFLFHHYDVFQPQYFLNRQLVSGQSAENFIGAGIAITSMDSLKPADITLISVPDDDIDTVMIALNNRDVLRKGDIIFHCSGAKSSACLKKKTAIHVASVHPILSFSEPRKTRLDCYCTLEGDPIACHILGDAFSAIGATTQIIQSEYKLAYHTAMVMVSNCLVGLMGAALEQFQRIGIEEKTALTMIQPLVIQCTSDIFRKGPTGALTGPISRGDWQLVNQELEQLAKTDRLHSEIYRTLGEACLKLASNKREKRLLNFDKMLKPALDS